MPARADLARAFMYASPTNEAVSNFFFEVSERNLIREFLTKVKSPREIADVTVHSTHPGEPRFARTALVRFDLVRIMSEVEFQKFSTVRASVWFLHRSAHLTCLYLVARCSL